MRNLTIFLGVFAAVFGITVIAQAVQISVPSAPAANYTLLSNVAGSYTASPFSSIVALGIFQQAMFTVSTSTRTGQYTDLQSALDALPAAGGKIHIRCGTYTLSASTTVAFSHVVIEGEGDCTKFNFDGTSVNPAFNTNNSTQRTDVVFKDFLINQTTVGGAGTAINGSNFARSTFDHVNITGANIGMDFGSVNALYNRIQDPLISVQGVGSIGIRFTNTANDNQVYSPRIVTDANSTGLYFDAHSNTCYSCDVETGALVGIDITANGNNTTLVNPYLEANITNLRLANGVQSVTMLGGYISTGSTANITDNGAVGFSAIGTRVQFLPVNYTNGVDFGINTINQQFRLEVGATTSQNVVRINGVSSANGAPVLSLFRKGSAEWTLAGGGGASSNFSIGANPAGGGLTDTDTNLLNAAKMTFTVAGNVGISTTTPWGKLAVNLNSSDTNLYAFTIASSTPVATTTLFQISNTGTVKAPQLANLSCIGTDSSGLFGAGSCTGGSGAWPFTTTDTNFGVAVQSTTTPEWFKNGVHASSTSQFVNATVWGNLDLRGQTTNGITYYDGSKVTTVPGFTYDGTFLNLPPLVMSTGVVLLNNVLFGENGYSFTASTSAGTTFSLTGDQFCDLTSLSVPVGNTTTPTVIFPSDASVSASKCSTLSPGQWALSAIVNKSSFPLILATSTGSGITFNYATGTPSTSYPPKIPANTTAFFLPIQTDATSVDFNIIEFSPFGSSVASGGGGTPGGSNTQLQFNSSGSFGGASLLTWDNTNKRFGIGSSTPMAGFTIGATTTVATDWTNVATTSAVTILSASTSSYMIVNYSTSALTLRWQSFGMYVGYNADVKICTPATAAGGAITWDTADANLYLNWSGKKSGQPFPSNTTAAGQCDLASFRVLPGGLGSSTPEMTLVGYTPGI